MQTTPGRKGSPLGLSRGMFGIKTKTAFQIAPFGAIFLFLGGKIGVKIQAERRFLFVDNLNRLF